MAFDDPGLSGIRISRQALLIKLAGTMHPHVTFAVGWLLSFMTCVGVSSDCVTCSFRSYKGKREHRLLALL